MSTTIGHRIVHDSNDDPCAVLIVEEGNGPPIPRPGEVLVLVTCSMIHRGDLQFVAARYATCGVAIPEARVPGLDAAGVIANAAADALDGTELAIGNRVMFFAPGAWQTLALVPIGALVMIHEDLSDNVATQLRINLIAARHVLRTALSGFATRPEQVLQLGAASAVERSLPPSRSIKGSRLPGWRARPRARRGSPRCCQVDISSIPPEPTGRKRCARRLATTWRS